MKLIYLHQYFSFPNENSGTRSYDLSKEFIKKGIDVEVITSTSNSKYENKRWTKIEEEGIIVNYLYLPYDNSMSYFERIIVFVKFLVFSTIKLLSIKCDIVLATSTPLTIGVPALIKKWFTGTPFIFEVRDVWPEAVIAIGAIKNIFIQKLLIKLEELIYSNAVSIVPLSDDMKNSIVTRFPRFGSKIDFVIENISELSRFNKVDVEINNVEKFIGRVPRFSVLYAGTFGKVNGIDYVVNLAEKTLVLDPDIVFILIGEGAEKSNIKDYARDKGVLNKNIFILPGVSKSELPNWYNSVSMGASFVIDIKALWANSANKFFDTLAASKPILINHRGWQANLIDQENIGYQLPPNLTDEDVSLFVEYTRNIENYSLQKSNALEIAKKCFSLEVASEKYFKILEKTGLYV